MALENSSRRQVLRNMAPRSRVAWIADGQEAIAGGALSGIQRFAVVLQWLADGGLVGGGGPKAPRGGTVCRIVRFTAVLQGVATVRRQLPEAAFAEL